MISLKRKKETDPIQIKINQWLKEGKPYAASIVKKQLEIQQMFQSEVKEQLLILDTAHGNLKSGTNFMKKLGEKISIGEDEGLKKSDRNKIISSVKALINVRIVLFFYFV